jgi:hypothetical protein
MPNYNILIFCVVGFTGINVDQCLPARSKPDFLSTTKRLPEMKGAFAFCALGRNLFAECCFGQK